MAYADFRNLMIEMVVSKAVEYVKAEWEGNVKAAQGFFESHGGALAVYSTPEMKEHIGGILDDLFVRSNAVPHENPADKQKIYLAGALGSKSVLLNLLKNKTSPELAEAIKLYERIAENAILCDFDDFKEKTSDKPIGIEGEVYYSLDNHDEDFPKMRGLFSGLHQAIVYYAKDYSLIIDNSLAPVSAAQYVNMIRDMQQEEGQFIMLAVALAPEDAVGLKVNKSRNPDDVRKTATAFAGMYDWSRELSSKTLLLNANGKVLYSTGNRFINAQNIEEVRAWKETSGIKREAPISVPNPAWVR